MGYFLLLYPTNSPKKQNFEKMKKTPGYVIILHMGTKIYDQMMYGYWDMVCDKCNYFSFWANFCPFTPLTARKIKILKKWKKHLEISSFYIWVPKIMIRWCMVPEIWCVTDAIIFHFGPIFALLLPPNSPKNQNFEKMKKTPEDTIILHMGIKNYDQMIYSSWNMVCDGCNYFSFWTIFCPFTSLTAKKIKNFQKMKKKKPGDIIILHTCTKNYDQMMYGSWVMLCDRWTDGQIDGWKKWHIEVGAPPKNKHLSDYIYSIAPLQIQSLCLQKLENL